MKNIVAFLLCTFLLTSCALPAIPNLLPAQNVPSATQSAPSLTPTETHTPLPTQPTATFTLTPTLVGFKTATFTAAPASETAAPAFTDTPPVVIPSQVINGFNLITLSAHEFYLGKCEPSSVKFTVQVAQPTVVLFVGLFVRLKGAVTGTTSPWTSLPMDNMGAGTFTHTLIPDEIKYLQSYEEPWVQYQLVATKAAAVEVGRTQIFDEMLRLKNCSSAQTTATPTP